MTATGHQTWTTRKLLTWMSGHFQAKGVESPRVVAEMLLAHVLDCERMRLYMEVDRPASPQELATLRALVARAAEHEPVQYLVGHAWFFTRAFKVTPAVLIPRPSTETLVEQVVHWCRAAPGHHEPLIADVGTGSGCLGISLAVELDQARIVATDPSPEALAVARENAGTHGVEGRMEFRLGAGLAPLGGEPGGTYDAICSNPPYISDAEWRDVPPNVKRYEPQLALRGGADGLDVIRQIVAGAAAWVRPGGRLFVEIADSQRDAALALVGASSGLREPRVIKDHEGLWRVLIADR